jgi:hypothetical protein
MLRTILGDLKTYIDGSEVEYTYSPLPLTVKHFAVDARYKVEIAVPCAARGYTFYCEIDVPKEQEYIGGLDGGQNLAAVTYENEIMMVTVGMDERGWSITYPYEGIQAVSEENRECASTIVLYVAWITRPEGIKGDVATWFLADPALSWR